jgi:hypothetical protein
MTRSRSCHFSNRSSLARPCLIRIVRCNLCNLKEKLSKKMKTRFLKVWFAASSVSLIVLALLVTAATPPKGKPEPTIIPIADIDRESVRVRTSAGERGAQLSFLFRDKDAQQARRTFFASKARQVRITDGVAIITETKLSGIVEHEINAKKRGGLILSFDTVEEANRVATALRPFLK